MLGRVLLHFAGYDFKMTADMSSKMQDRGIDTEDCLYITLTIYSKYGCKKTCGIL
jgi:hypothetical protein